MGCLLSTRVIANIMTKDTEQLRMLLNEVSAALKDDPKIDILIFFCGYGKHRSVRVGDITSHATRLASSAWALGDMVHLMRRYWPIHVDGQVVQSVTSKPRTGNWEKS